MSINTNPEKKNDSKSKDKINGKKNDGRSKDRVNGKRKVKSINSGGDQVSERKRADGKSYVSGESNLDKNSNAGRNRSVQGKSSVGKKSNVGLIIGGIIVVLLIIAAGTLFFVQANQKKTQIKVKQGAAADTTAGSGQESSDGGDITYKGQQYEYNRDIKTLLFLGVDKKGELESTKYPGEGGQSDCIILIAMNQKDKTFQIFQISRNAMTDVDVYSSDGKYLLTTKTQLALQYSYGDGKKKSVWLTKKAVSNLLYGIPIDYSIAMDISGIPVINDMLGGIRITIPEDYTNIDPAFKKGSTITLTGEQAERYVRYRDITVTGSNNQRMERQTQFVMALMSQLKGASKNDTQLYAKLMTGANPYFITDMSADEIMALSGYDMDGKVITLPGKEVAGARHDEFHVDDEKLREIIVKTFYKCK